MHNLHVISNPVFWKKREKNTNQLSSAILVKKSDKGLDTLLWEFSQNRFCFLSERGLFLKERICFQNQKETILKEFDPFGGRIYSFPL